MKTFYNSVVFFTICFCFCSCFKAGGPCEEPMPIGYLFLTLTFKDSLTNKYIYDNTSPLYNKDSLQISLKEDSTEKIDFSLNNIDSINAYWEASTSFFFDKTDLDESVHAEICKKMIIKYSYNEADTIDICFETKYTKCSSVFKSLKFYRKDQLLFSGYNIYKADIIISKN